MSIVHYEPKDFLDRFWAGSFHEPSHSAPADGLKVNISETEDRYVLAAEVPGWAEKDIQLEMKDGRLVLKGHVEEQKEPNESEENTYRVREFFRRSFERSFRLGDQIDQEHVEASMENGILTVILPKREEVKPRSVKIQIKS